MYAPRSGRTYTQGEPPARWAQLQHKAVSTDSSRANPRGSGVCTELVPFCSSPGLQRDQEKRRLTATRNALLFCGAVEGARLEVDAESEVDAPRTAVNWLDLLRGLEEGQEVVGKPTSRQNNLKSHEQPDWLEPKWLRNLRPVCRVA